MKELATCLTRSTDAAAAERFGLRCGLAVAAARGAGHPCAAPAAGAHVPVGGPAECYRVRPPCVCVCGASDLP